MLIFLYLCFITINRMSYVQKYIRSVLLKSKIAIEY